MFVLGAVRCGTIPPSSNVTDSRAMCGSALSTPKQYLTREKSHMHTALSCCCFDPDSTISNPIHHCRICKSDTPCLPQPPDELQNYTMAISLEEHLIAMDDMLFCLSKAMCSQKDSSQDCSVDLLRHLLKSQNCQRHVYLSSLAKQENSVQVCSASLLHGDQYPKSAWCEFMTALYLQTDFRI